MREVAVIILQHPDKKLREVSAPVDLAELFAITSLAKQMALIIHQHEALGLSAVQVGIPTRLFVARPKSTDHDVFVCINPVIAWRSHGQSWDKEGCLSLDAGIPRIRVKRHDGVRLDFTDIHGQPQSKKCAGLLARVFQHEMDHLDGKLIIDYQEVAGGLPSVKVAGVTTE